MTDPIKGQDKILQYGTAPEQEPMLDTLASLARTAISDPYGLPDSTLPDPDDRGAGVRYALERLDDIIEALNPSDESFESFARTFTILGRHLAERADYMQASTWETEVDLGRSEDAFASIQAALDLIDEAIVALTEERSAS